MFDVNTGYFDQADSDIGQKIDTVVTYIYKIS
jgi:hypothetical protein